MKRDLIIIFLLAITAILVAWTRSPQPIDYQILSRAIAQVEGDRGRVGSAGEIGPLQITTICRRDLARIGHPISEAGCRDATASAAALAAYCRHYQAASPRDAAALWNGGPKRSGSGDYAARVEAIYQRLQKQQKHKKAKKRKSVNTVSRTISVRIPLADWLQIEELAKQTGSTPSDWMRHQLRISVNQPDHPLVFIDRDLASDLSRESGSILEQVVEHACERELQRLKDAKHLAKLKKQRDNLNAAYEELRVQTVQAKLAIVAGVKKKGGSHA